MQAQMIQVLQELFGDFLCSDSNDPEKREAPDARTEIESNLLHRYYLSQKDIDTCLAFDIGSLSGHVAFPAINVLFDDFTLAYQKAT